MNDVSTAQRIRKIMKQKELTQKDLSEILGISQPAISLYLQGRMPPADILYQIAQLGGTSVEWILTGIESEQGIVKESEPVYGNQHLLLRLWKQIPTKLQRDFLTLLKSFIELKGESKYAGKSDSQY